MEKEICSKLLKYQIPHAENIVNILKNKNICLDGSDTGTGKTYVAMAVIKHLKLKPIIICPKTIMSSWQKVANIFNVEVLCIVNYETITRGKYYNKNKIDSEIRTENPYVEIDEKYIDYYKWTLPENTLIIFDEAHHCCNDKTLNAKLLLSLQNIYNNNVRILLLSASLAYNQVKFKVFGYLFKWYDNINWAPDWIKNPKYNPASASIQINNKLYPDFGNRMRIADLGSDFPISQISAESYDIPNFTKIEKEYNEIKKVITDIKEKNKEDNNIIFTKIIRARQSIELYKIPIFIELTNEFLENGYSVVIFVNFVETLNILAKKLNTTCIISGEQNLKTKENNIDNFVSNLNRVIICNIQSGSEAISLNDKTGLHPRISLISPTWSGTKLLQAFGRTQRSDSKSIALNRIIFCAKTIEEKICNRINDLIKNLNVIRDDDLNVFSNNY